MVRYARLWYALVVAIMIVVAKIATVVQCWDVIRLNGIIILSLQEAVISDPLIFITSITVYHNCYTNDSYTYDLEGKCCDGDYSYIAGCISSLILERQLESPKRFSYIRFYVVLYLLLYDLIGFYAGITILLYPFITFLLLQAVQVIASP